MVTKTCSLCSSDFCITAKKLEKMCDKHSVRTENSEYFRNFGGPLFVNACMNYYDGLGENESVCLKCRFKKACKCDGETFCANCITYGFSHMGANGRCGMCINMCRLAEMKMCINVGMKMPTNADMYLPDENDGVNVV